MDSRGRLEREDLRWWRQGMVLEDTLNQVQTLKEMKAFIDTAMF